MLDGERTTVGPIVDCPNCDTLVNRTVNPTRCPFCKGDLDT